MELRVVFNVLFLTLYLARWAPAQTIYDSRHFYQPMTNDLDARSHGSLFLPVCMKNLMNCWEVVSPDLFCKYTDYYRLTLESMCMDLRFQCMDHTGPLPFQTVNVSTWKYCTINRVQHRNAIKDAYYPETWGINNWNNWS